MTLRVLPIAEDEAFEAACWYDDRQSGLGNYFLDLFSETFDRIESQPRRFSQLETVTSRREIRRCLLPRFPYAVIYEIIYDEIVVLAVSHTRRRPNDWNGR